MKKHTLIALGLMTAGLAMTAPASAATLLTPWQDHAFGKNSLNQSQNILVDGFDSSLGTLTSVHLQYTISESLFNTASVDPQGSGDQEVGASLGNPLTATATVTAAGPGGLTATNTLTTPGFSGFIVDNIGTQTVGTTSITNFLVGPTVLTSGLGGYIGGTSSVTITVSSNGTQGGSVTDFVLTGNKGSYTGTLSIRYDYFVPDQVPEPASLSLIGIGLAGAAVARRRKAKKAA